MADKRDIKTLSSDDLRSFARDLGLKKFRVKQIQEWLFAHGISSFDEMSNLPKSLREQLKSLFDLGHLECVTRLVSHDGTRKYLFSLPDGVTVESVGIPSHDRKRLTVCFSTQAGCPMGCVFCATGLGGFVRNLESWEIYDQVRLVGEDFGLRVSNAVGMGQGEPFNNYDNVLHAMRMMNNPNYLDIGARHITVSTCGVIAGIQKFSDEPEQFTLAVSLHSAIQDSRDSLMPGIKHNTLKELRSALSSYVEKTNRRPTLEYTLIAGSNDDRAHLEALIGFCQGLLCHVNLISLNQISDSDSSTPQFLPSEQADVFLHSLMSHGIEASKRASRGSDIDGACGQLRQNYLLQ